MTIFEAFKICNIFSIQLLHNCFLLPQNIMIDSQKIYLSLAGLWNFRYFLAGNFHEIPVILLYQGMLCTVYMLFVFSSNVQQFLVTIR